MKSSADSTAHSPASTQSGELPDPPSEKTLSSQQFYARALLADQTPLQAGEGTRSKTWYHRKLVQLYHMPIKFTWDDAAVNEISRNQFLLWDEIDDVTDDLLINLGDRDDRDFDTPAKVNPYAQGPISKVKEIHFTVSDKTRSQSDPNCLAGFWPSFNASTGVLTLAISKKNEYGGTTLSGGLSGPAADKPLGKWSMKHVS